MSDLAGLIAMTKLKQDLIDKNDDFVAKLDSNIHFLLKVLRERKKLNFTEVSKLTGIPHTSLLRFEGRTTYGKALYPKYWMLKELCILYGFSYTHACEIAARTQENEVMS
ncbi:helix-turn-helix transcriptional regulator [Kordiimonas sp. SCSIO 12610]|uniref:helix-turn-helix domain-containing protein n=1 Tax=Kordiimonas sp. SCSIO 12610 TaxID=2829597 RepID=UPI00210D2E48|nr:helix-turn-helix transcriptional regulator [Kordiimonas sp. SCSIO 12610]UTW53950.1 helix-turn-helix domain-containing protein [Kordiimonas sp. SCSIO 12610]